MLTVVRKWTVKGVLLTPRTTSSLCGLCRSITMSHHLLFCTWWTRVIIPMATRCLCPWHINGCCYRHLLKWPRLSFVLRGQSWKSGCKQTSQSYRDKCIQNVHTKFTQNCSILQTKGKTLSVFIVHNVYAMIVVRMCTEKAFIQYNTVRYHLHLSQTGNFVKQTRQWGHTVKQTSKTTDSNKL